MKITDAGHSVRILESVIKQTPSHYKLPHERMVVEGARAVLEEYGSWCQWSPGENGALGEQHHNPDRAGAVLALAQACAQNMERAGMEIPE